MTPFQATGHRIDRAELADAPRVQALFERDPAYFEIVEAAPLRPTEGNELLVECPPGFPLERKHVFLVDDVAVLDVLDGFPDERTWYLGLVFIAPAARGNGLGSALIEALCSHVRANGGAALRLAVVPANTGARRLYDRLGFTPVARRPRTGWNGVVVEVDVLERALAPG